MKDRLSRVTTKISKTLFDTKMFFKEKGNKYPLLFSLFGVILSTLSVVGVTYSLWTDTAETGNNTISTGTISMRYVEDTSFASINNAEPMSAADAYQSNNYFPFQVVMEASGNAELNYEITVTTQNTTTFSYDTDQKIRIGLKKENNIITDAGFNIEGNGDNVNYTNGVIVGTLPTSGSVTTGNPQTVYKGTISSNGTETVHNFKLYLWLDENAPANSVSEKYALTINVNTGNSAPNYQRYTLTYNNQGGSGCSTKQVRPNNPWGELCTPTRKNYTFEGWYTGQNGTGTEVTSTTTASNNQTVYAYFTSRTLYAVLEKASEEGTYAKAYTGDHQDSMNASLSTETIYHWYGSSAANGTAILDKNNVIFAGHCWQMIRTTDTGGVRLIYNGEVVDGKCLNTRGTHVGYGGIRSSQSLNGTYWYGTDYTYDSSTSKFSLSGTTLSKQVTSNNASTVIPTLVGKYTCKSTTESGTCSTLYLIESYNSSYNAYAIPINSSSNYSQFGTLQFNATYDSLAYAGYMYNTVYPTAYKSYSSETVLTTGISLSTTWYYADSYDYNETNANNYTLTNPYQVSSTSDYSSLVGKYTLRSSSSTYSNSQIYYIVGINGSTMYGILLSGGNNLSYYTNDTYTYGTSYTDNGNGTYTINNPTTINRTDYYTSYTNMKSKYICKNATNNTCSDVWHATSVLNQTYIYYYKSSSLYKYAKGFTYNSSTGEYTLSSDNVTFWDTMDSSNTTSLNTHHYTCFDTTGVCSTLSYVHYNSSGLLSGLLYYINLTGGKDVDDILEEVLSANNVNTKNSTMKTGIDAWYKKYLLPYDSYIDDTIYCNDRSIRSLGGFNPDGGSVTSYLQFKEYTVGSDLSCTNVTDKFSVSNSSAQLTYKVGLMSSPEMNLLNHARKTGQDYWLVSPYCFVYDVDGHFVGSVGGWGTGSVGSAYGARPAVSLISGIEYTTGDGSMANPYVILDSSGD